MSNMTMSLLVAGVFALALHAAPAQAQLARTFVSNATGSDLNDCSRNTPCRTFQTAHDKTLANGEITVLDPGGYGAVTINRTISIINDGVGEAGALVSGGVAGITIAALATDKVSLRGLTIKGIGFGGGTGIIFNTGAALTVENCAIRNIVGGGNGDGIRFQPSASSNLVVSNTFIADTGGSGILVLPATGNSGTINVIVNRVESYGNHFHGVILNGFQSTGPINATMTDSIAANNTFVGVLANSDVGHSPVNLLVTRSAVSNNATGLEADTNSFFFIGQSTVTGNATTFATSGGMLRSYGDNYIDRNGDGSPPPTTTPRK